MSKLPLYLQPRYTCYVYGRDGLFGAYEVRGSTQHEAKRQCRARFAEEPIGRDVKPAKPKLVLRKR